MTADEAHAKMLDWAEGRMSHWNVIVGLMPNERRGEAIARAAEADAAEVAKWAAVYSATAQAEAAEAIRIAVATAADRLRP